MGSFRYPAGNITVEQVIPVDNPEHVKRIGELEKENQELKARPAKVVERVVEKIVEKPIEDKALLEQLNVVLRENAQLKKFQQPVKHVDRVVEKVVEVEKCIDRVVSNRKMELTIGVISALSGFGVGILF